MRCIHCKRDATSSIRFSDCTFYLCNKHFIEEYNDRFIDGVCIINTGGKHE